MPKTDKLASALEYLLVFLFLRGAVNVLFFTEPALDVPAVLTQLAGDEAIFVYGTAFLTEGLLLLYAKWFKKKKVHQWTLFSMFLTCLYITFLALAISGLVAGLILPVFVSVLTSILWLRWKFKTEYIDPGAFHKEIEQLRKDA